MKSFIDEVMNIQSRHLFGVMVMFYITFYIRADFDDT